MKHTSLFEELWNITTLVIAVPIFVALGCIKVILDRRP